MKQLTASQKRMMARLAAGPETSPPLEQIASLAAWHRIAAALERKGLVTTTRNSTCWTAKKV